MHHVLFILICCIWGTSFMLMKVGLPAFGPVGVAAWRVSTGAVAIAVLWHLQKKRWPVKRRDVIPLIAISVVGSVVPFSLQPYIIRVIEAHSAHGSSFAGMMVTLVPLLTIIASVPLLKVHPTRRQLMGVGGGLAAMGVLFAGELRHGVSPGDLLLAAITPGCYALSNTYIRRRFARMPTLALLLATLTLASVMLVPASVVAGAGPAQAGVAADPPAAAASFATAVAAMVVLGVVCTGLATFMYYKLLQNQGPLFASMVTYIIPCVAMLVGWARGETITGVQIAALAGIFAMVALVQTAHR